MRMWFKRSVQTELENVNTFALTGNRGSHAITIRRFGALLLVLEEKSESFSVYFHAASFRTHSSSPKRIVHIHITYMCRRNFICESIVSLTRFWNMSPFSALGPMNQAPRADHGLWRPWERSFFANMLLWGAYIDAGLAIRFLFPASPAVCWAGLLRLWSISAA